MIAGHLQEKYGFFYIVLSYRDENGKRHTPWFPTKLPVKGNKKRAEALLRLDPMPRELLVLLVDTVTVGERRPDGTQEVSIRWLL